MAKVLAALSNNISTPKANYSSSATPTRQRLDFSQDASTTRERNRTVTSFYNQSAVDAAAGKVRLSQVNHLLSFPSVRIHSPPLSI